MELIADFLLVAGALGAGFYCFILARRLNRFNDLEKGVGGAVAVLSAQVDDLTRTLVAAREASDGSNSTLVELTQRAESVAQRLELMMASLHDLPGQDVSGQEIPGRKNSGQENGLMDTPPPVPPAADPPRAPSGPMFVRHERNASGAPQ